jgi:hypothetical protein
MFFLMLLCPLGMRKFYTDSVTILKLYLSYEKFIFVAGTSLQKMWFLCYPKRAQ